MNRLHRSLPALLLSCVPLAAHAQWSDNPADNLVVSDIAGGNVQPQIVPTPDGGFYVSWFDNIAAGFDVHLQRLDAGGNALWPHNGVLVADRDYSSTYDYGIAADVDGNAYVTYNCCEGGAADQHIAVSKFSPDGSPAWGPDGIRVSGTDEAVYNAYVDAAADGSVVVAWSCDGGVRAQKLDADGNPLWQEGGVLVDQPSGLKLLGGVRFDPDGNAIVSWSNQAGAARILTAQKLAGADGTPMWNGGTGVRVFSEGNLQFGYYPPFLADGAGGGVFWDYDYSGGIWVPRVQHLDADGNALLGAAGVIGTTEPLHDHVSTSATFDPASGDIYLVWDETYIENMQNYDGVYAQRIDADGNRAWGDTGKVLVEPVISTDSLHAISQLIALPAPGGFVASWVTGATPAVDQPLTAARLDADGDYVWASQDVVVESLGATSNAVGAVSHDGGFAWAWQDGADDAQTIRAQNVNDDGSLGPLQVDDTVFKDGFDGSE